MTLMVLNDPSSWILISFLLLVGTCSVRILKGVNAQLRKRQEEISRQISEVNILYEEAKILLTQAEKTLEIKKQEADFLRVETLKEVENRKQILKSNIRALHKKYENDLRQKMEVTQQKLTDSLIKNLLEESCTQAEIFLREKINQPSHDGLIKEKIEKLDL